MILPALSLEPELLQWQFEGCLIDPDYSSSPHFRRFLTTSTEGGGVITSGIIGFTEPFFGFLVSLFGLSLLIFSPLVINMVLHFNSAPYVCKDGLGF